MSSEIMPFQFGDQAIRVLELGDAVWFVAGDVAQVLGYRDALNMVRWLDEDEADTHNLSIRSENGTIQSREVTIISESGLYNAVLKSRRPEAKPFRRWVTEEVLPSIRKTGGYHRGRGTRTAADAPDEEMRRLERARVRSFSLVDACIKAEVIQNLSLRQAVIQSILEDFGVGKTANLAPETVPLPAVQPIPTPAVPVNAPNPAGKLAEFLSALLPLPYLESSVGELCVKVYDSLCVIPPIPDRVVVRRLGLLGIAVKEFDETRYLAIADDSPALARLLSGTPWEENGSWVPLFDKIKGVRTRRLTFSAFNLKAHLLPVATTAPLYEALVLAPRRSESQDLRGSRVLQ